MSSMQSVVVAGHLGSDPELKVTSGGVQTCTFSIAVNRPYGKHDTDWVPVRCWRTEAETAAKYLHKGSFVIVAGRFESYVKELVLDGGEVRRFKFWTLVVESLTFGPKSSPGGTVSVDEPEPVPPPAKPVATE